MLNQFDTLPNYLCSQHRHNIERGRETPNKSLSNSKCNYCGFMHEIKVIVIQSFGCCVCVTHRLCLVLLVLHEKILLGHFQLFAFFVFCFVSSGFCETRHLLPLLLRAVLIIFENMHVFISHLLIHNKVYFLFLFCE